MERDEVEILRLILGVRDLEQFILPPETSVPPSVQVMGMDFRNYIQPPTCLTWPSQDLKLGDF